MQVNNIELITGGIAKDERGEILFVNEFDMSEVKRFYIIRNADINLIRGWRGHRIEKRWFYVLSGKFEFNIIEIDNWEVPSKTLPINKINVGAEDLRLLCMSAGFATAIRALEPNSELLVYADHLLNHASKDDYTWDLSYFELLNE